MTPLQIHNLSRDLLAVREVQYIDIANDEVEQERYKASEDPRRVRCEKRGIGPLVGNWRVRSSTTTMCSIHHLVQPLCGALRTTIRLCRFTETCMDVTALNACAGQGAPHDVCVQANESRRPRVWHQPKRGGFDSKGAPV